MTTNGAGEQSPWGQLVESPHILLIFTMLFWAGNSVASKLAVGHVSPMMLTTGRWSIALIVVWWMAYGDIKRDWAVIRTNLPYLLVMGFTGYTLFNALFYTAGKYTSGINIAIEQAAIPLFIFIGNFLIFRIATTSRQWLGFGLSIIGVILVVTHGNPMRLFDTGLNFGDFLMLLSIIVYAAYSIGLKAKPDLHWKSFFAVMVTSAFLTSIPFLIWEVNNGELIVPVTAQGIGVVIYAAIFPSIASQIFFILAVDKLGANLSSLYINLVPIFGTLLAVAILGEAPGWHHAIGLLLVVGGIVFAQTQKQIASS
jgi:drug/metabolite transporter (DMT)-like permease